MERSYIISTLLLSTTVMATGVATTGCAQDDHSNNSQSAATDTIQDTNDSSANPVARQGRMVFIDPKTGEMTSKPSEEQMSRMAEAQSKSVGRSRSGIASAPRTMSNGTVIVDLNGQFSKPIKAAVKENNQVEIGHDVDSTDN